MASKTLIVLGVLFAAAVLISSEVAAREVAGQHEEKVSSVGVVADPKYEHGGYGNPVVSDGHGGSGGGGHECHHGCCKWGCHHGCCSCCSTADEIPVHEPMPEHKN